MYYKHSGRFTLGGLILSLLAGAVSAPFLAYAYAHGLILITEAHLSAVATAAFAGLIGLAVGGALVVGKVRNLMFTWLTSIGASVLAFYLSWAMWIPAVLEGQHVESVSWTRLALQPSVIWRMACFINQYGTWGLSGGSTMKGLELWGFWIAEAAAVIGLAVVAAVEVVNYRPFCETCDNWCSGSKAMLLAPPRNVQQLKLQLEANDLRPLEALAPGSKGASHLSVKFNACDRCRAFDTMSITHCVVTRDRLRRTKIANRRIMRNLLVGPGRVETLRHLSEKLAQAAKLTTPQAKGATVGKR